jgi:nucleotide-binding universal stress UspA family protein
VYHRILVPLDGSRRAEAILPHAVELAKRFAAEVLLLQVIEPLPLVTSVGVPVPVMPVAEMNELVDRVTAYLVGIADSLHAQEVKARPLVVEGKIVDRIIGTAEEEGADLIAIASHGRGGLAKLFYGSVASALLQHANQPLLMVRSPDGERELSHLGA